MTGLPVLPEHRAHERSFDDYRYVYPVLSRRSRGISIGLNLNPDKICNFDCVYCQVDRRSDAIVDFVDLSRLLGELEGMLEAVTSGRIFEHPRFAAVPQPLRRLNDIAFSGDGEPTTLRNFEQVVAEVAQVKRRWNLADVKMIVITNASVFDRASVQRGLDLLMEQPGEIWAKLDAGTADYFHLIERTPIGFARILDNLRRMALRHPLVIQSLFLRLEGLGPEEREIAAYVERLREIAAPPAQLARVQIYTVARRPAEDYVSALADAEVDRIAEQVAAGLGGIVVERFYGSTAE